MLIARLILKRLFNLLSALFVVATLTFFLMKAIPGNPFQQEQMIPEEILKSMNHHYGLDRPLFEQYLSYLKKIFTLSLGPSFRYEGRSVNQIIWDGFPISLLLGSMALSISIFMGILLGSLSAFYKGKWQDQAFTFLSVLGISIPSFVLATLLQFIFAIKLNFFPIARSGTLSHMILPAFSLAALPTAFIARLIRSSMIEVLSQDYIWMAKAKGLSSFNLMRRHVLKNSSLPALSYIGHLSASVLTGSFVIEKIFAIPGLGHTFVSSITNRDYTLIMGITLFYSGFLMICICIVDIIYLIIDPRVRRSYER
jgi:oligopeptide transport system permease protein